MEKISKIYKVGKVKGINVNVKTEEHARIPIKKA